MGDRAGLIKAYRQFKRDSRGWGVPTFADFRARLWPLRRRREWADADMTYVLELQQAGADAALRALFRAGAGAATAAKLLGEPGASEVAHLARDVLERELTALIRSCARSVWKRGDFEAYLTYLDSERTVADLGRDASARAAELGERAPKQDRFAENFRGAHAEYKRVVRESLARAADAASATKRTKS